MSAKAISEQTGKEFLYKYICTSAAVQNRFRYANVTAETDFDRLSKEHPWLLTEVRQKKPKKQSAWTKLCVDSEVRFSLPEWTVSCIFTNVPAAHCHLILWKMSSSWWRQLLKLATRVVSWRLLADITDSRASQKLCYVLGGNEVWLQKRTQ